MPDQTAEVVKVTDAQASMLWSHASVYPSPVAHTPELGSVRTWHALYDKGLLARGTLTAAGIALVVRRYGTRHFPEALKNAA